MLVYLLDLDQLQGFAEDRRGTTDERGLDLAEVEKLPRVGWKLSLKRRRETKVEGGLDLVEVEEHPLSYEVEQAQIESRTVVALSYQ